MLAISSQIRRLGRRFVKTAVLAITLSGITVGILPPAAKAETKAKVSEELHCLSLNVYFEARGELDEGKIAVAHVVMNRVQSARFPDTVCGVVQQGGEDTLHRCQFSWWCDGRSDRPSDQVAWAHSKAIAQQVYWALSDDPTGGALWYHARYVKPSWGKRFVRSAAIGEHVFYLPTKRLASADNTASSQ